MNKSIVLALLGVLTIAGSASAQTESRFRTGALSWTPTLTLREAGTDSNVYDEATNPRSDTSATLAPHVEGVFAMSAATVRFSGGADFVYFHRYTSERSINTRGSVRADLRGWRIRPFGRASFLDSRERVNSEIDVRARRRDRDFDAGLGLQLTTRGTLDLSASFGESTYRQGETFLGVDLPRRLNRQTVGAVARFAYEATPLTRFVAEGSAARDRFTLSPGYDGDNLRARVGVEFEPAAVLNGRAFIGFHRLVPLGELGLGFDGLTTTVELGYVLLQRTRFDLRVSRDASYSLEAQPYFLQTLYGGQITHTLLQWLDVGAQASKEAMDYPGIPERFLPTHTLNVMRYGGSVAVRPSQRTRIAGTYEFSERAAELFPDRRYDRRRFFTTITYGF
jgi:Putative beta-barrel porin 2